MVLKGKDGAKSMNKTQVRDNVDQKNWQKKIQGTTIQKQKSYKGDPFLVKHSSRRTTSFAQNQGMVSRMSSNQANVFEKKMDYVRSPAAQYQR